MTPKPILCRIFGHKRENRYVPSNDWAVERFIGCYCKRKKCGAKDCEECDGKGWINVVVAVVVTVVVAVAVAVVAFIVINI